MNVIEIEALSRALGQTAFEFLLRSCVLFAVGALALVVLRTRSAEIRYFVCRGLLYGLLCLPLLQVAAPPQLVMNSGEHVNQFGPFPWISTAAGVYALLTFAFLLRLAIGVVRVHRIVRRSEPILDRHLQELAHDMWLESLSSFKPRIRTSAEINVPMVAGIHEFSILLPISWRVWASDKLRAALVHEMAHIRRGDPQTAFLAAFTACVFWIHPLIYWLRRQLADLSEQACDDVVLAQVRPERYARILIEFASDVAITGTRFLAAPAVVADRSSLKKRLERIFFTDRHPDAHPRRTRLIVTALFFGGVYLSAAGRFVPARNDAGQNVISIENSAQALRFESELQKYPNDLRVRDALIVFYANQRNEAKFARHTLWVVEHYPEDSIVAVTSNFFPTPGNYERLKAAWQEALGMHSDSAEVLYHAGLFFESKDPQRALDLFTRAKSMTLTDHNAQERYFRAIAFLYGAAIISDVKNGNPNWRFNNITIPANTAMTLRADVDTSIDPKLLSEVGAWLIKIGDDQVAQMGLTYIENGIQLDPGNPKWKEALESAKAEPIRRRNIRLLTGH